MRGSKVLVYKMPHQVQAAEMGLLHKLHRLTRREKVRNGEIREGLQGRVTSLPNAEMHWFCHVSSTDWRCSADTPTGMRPNV